MNHQPNVPKIFLDCDGVLADFDAYANFYFGMPPRQYEAQMGSDRFWSELEIKGDFYRNLPLMPDARVLIEGVRHLNPTILTGCPRGNWAQKQKVEWAHEHFPGIPVTIIPFAYFLRNEFRRTQWALPSTPPMPLPSPPTARQGRRTVGKPSGQSDQWDAGWEWAAYTGRFEDRSDDLGLIDAAQSLGWGFGSANFEAFEKGADAFLSGVWDDD